MGLRRDEMERLQAIYGPTGFPYYRELPAHQVLVKPFGIAEAPVTNAEYLELVEAGSYEKDELWTDLFADPVLDGAKLLSNFTDQTGRPGPLTWVDGRPRRGTDDHPVSGVSWFEARVYSRFKGLRLPSEAEWELAARGSDGRLYPWGNQFEPQRCGNDSHANRDTWPVGSLQGGRSAYGLLHMVGNVAQWVDELFASYPGSESYGMEGRKDRVVRGDFYYGTAESLRATVRSPQPPEARFPGLGLRCARNSAR